MIRLPDIPGLQGQAVNSPTANATMGRSQTAAAAPQMAAQSIRPQGIEAQSVRPIQVASPQMAQKGPDASFIERRDILPTGRGAMAIAAGIGKIGDAIFGVGQQFAGVALDAQRQENARIESAGRLALVGAKAQFDLELENEMDPAARIEKTRKFYEDQRTLLDDMDAPDVVRASLGDFHTVESTKGLIRAGGDAAQLTRKNLGFQLENEMKQAMDSGDAGLMNRALSSAIAGGVIMPQQAVGYKMEFDKSQQEKAELAGIAADPLTFMEQNPAGRMPAGADPVKYEKLQNFARGQLRQRTFDASANILDAVIEGKITTPEQIDAAASDLRPAAREELKAALLQQTTAGYKEMIATPEYQAQTVGKVSSLLADYKPDGENFDAPFVQMDAMVRTLPPGAVRDELERRIKNVRDERGNEVKTHADAADKALDEAFKAGLFGKAAGAGADMPTARALNDGFLDNGEKLKSLGLTDEQIAPVLEGKTRADKLNAFRALGKDWSKRQGATADAFTTAAAEAILNGKESIRLASPEGTRDAARAAVEAQMRFGKAKTDFAEWRKLNPEASAKEIEDKIFTLAGEEPRRQLSSGIYDAKPSRGGSASTGDRITSYGYAGDTTPDSNSTAGIGAWVGDTEATQIKAGETTPNRLQAGDFAVSRDVEAQFREAGIKPGDRISVKTADGTMLSGRWMDRTAESYNGKKLTGRFDVYSPTGASPLDGKSVIGWMRDLNRNNGEFSDYNVLE